MRGVDPESGAIFHDPSLSIREALNGKGQEGAAIKKAAAERWCKAVTNDGRFGSWAYRICWSANDIVEVLEAHEESAKPALSGAEQNP